AARRGAAACAELAVARRGLAAAPGKVAARPALRRALLRLQAWHDVGLERLAGIGLDVEDLAAIAELGERHGQAVAAGTAGAADAVRVVLGFHRQAVVEDVRDRGH